MNIREQLTSHEGLCGVHLSSSLFSFLCVFLEQKKNRSNQRAAHDTVRLNTRVPHAAMNTRKTNNNTQLTETHNERSDVQQQHNITVSDVRYS